MAAGCATVCSLAVATTGLQQRPHSCQQAWSRHRCGQGAMVLLHKSVASVYAVWSSRKQKVQVAAGLGPGAEKAFQTTVEVDRLIDNLRETEQEKLPQVISENVLSFDSAFWLRLANRADLCKSKHDQKGYELLASQIMTVVEHIVQKTKEKIESSTDILKSILSPLIESDGEIIWPPRNQQSLIDMRKEVELREKDNFLDESFLAEVSAQLRQANDDADKPGLVAILQKVLQLYAASILSKRSYSVKDGSVDTAEELLEKIITADEGDWETSLRTGLVYGGGQVKPEDLFAAVDRRVERTLMRTESGSYQQRILVEYVRGIETRARALVEAFQASPPAA